MFVREWQGPTPVAHGSTGNAGENGCSRFSPSVLINFILSSVLIIDNLVGSRPSFLTAPCKLLQNAQQLTLVSLRKQNNTPSKKKEKTTTSKNQSLFQLSLRQSTEWCQCSGLLGQLLLGYLGRRMLLGTGGPGLLNSYTGISKEARKI